MREKVIRIVAAVLCVAIVFGLAAIFVFQEPAAAGGAITADTVMLEVSGGEDIKAAEYIYYVLNVRANYEQENGVDIWTNYPTLSDSILSELDEMLLQNQAFLNWGSDEGFELGEEDNALFDERIEELKAQLDEGADLDDYFAASNLTMEMFRDIFTRDLYIDRFLSDYMTPEHPFMAFTEEELDTYIEENQILGAKHILIQNDEEEDPEENLRLAEELLDRIKAGEDFDALMNEYTEDTGITDNPDGYTFGKDEFVAEFEAATLALEIDEVSEIVESDYGYHIIKRIEVNRDEATTKAQQQRLYDKYVEYREALVVTKTDARNNLKIEDAVPVL